jgi:hypothetical protein
LFSYVRIVGSTAQGVDPTFDNFYFGSDALDTTPPNITCPANVTVGTDSGQCNATGVALGWPSTSDNSGGTVTVWNNAPAQYPQGVTTVTWTAQDPSGNTATCAQTVTVIDTQPPAGAPPPNVTVSTDPGQCYATGVALGTPTASDNCGSVTVWNNAPAQYPKGVTTVTWWAQDTSGNTISGPQTVTVIDTQPPGITCPANVTVNADSGQCYATGVALGTPSTSDNCGIASVNNNAPAHFNKGVTTVIWTVVDTSGNTATCGQTVTVNDTQPPSITCPANVMVSTDSGHCYATAVALGTPATGDNCGTPMVSNNAPAQYPKGVTTVTWTVADASGNTATCAQTVTVDDTQPPTITCPADVMVSVNDGCTATNVALGSPVTGDNCSVASVGNNALAVYPLGATVVTWTVTDGSGNTTTGTQEVVVLDDTPPTITCLVNLTVTANDGSTATGVVLGSPVTGDNCHVASVVNNGPASYPLGTNSVTWTVTDGSGNTATCTQQVIVRDTTPPTIIIGPADVIIHL